MEAWREVLTDRLEFAPPEEVKGNLVDWHVKQSDLYRLLGVTWNGQHPGSQLVKPLLTDMGIRHADTHIKGSVGQNVFAGVRYSSEYAP